MQIYKKTITKRGVVWLGQTCNLNCYFCYFKDKIDNKEDPEHQFMNLEKAKKIMYTLKYIYGNNAVDIQGGEPTIYPYIYELIEYCNKIDLKPTLITNGIVLANEEIVKQYKKVKINDFLVSIHSIGSEYDRIVGLKGASEKQMKAIFNLQKYNIPFRLNCTMTIEAGKQLLDIANFAVKNGAVVVNFITFNPFADQQGKRDLTDVPKYIDLKENLQKAIDILEDNNIEVNIRYFPLCMLNDKYRKNVYNFQQLPYDDNEWDYNSWTWTTRFNQRSNSITLDKPIPILMYNINNYNGIDFSKFSKFGTKTHYHLEDTEEFLLKLFNADIPKEFLYKNNAKLRVEKHLNYRKSEECQKCSLNDICDGFHGDYVEVFGMNEAKAVILDECPLESIYYIKYQKKVNQ